MKPKPEHRYVVGLLFNQDFNRVVLIQKNRPDWQKGKLNGVGGHIEYGETPDDAMRREFKEEVGVDFSLWHHFAHLLGTTPEGEAFEVYFFCGATEFGDFKSMTDEKVIVVATVDVLAHVVGTVSNIPWLVAMAHHTHSHDWPYRVEEKSPKHGLEWWRGVYDFADAVSATADEDGCDLEENCSRLGGLLSEALEQPERWPEFKAPDVDLEKFGKGDEDEDGSDEDDER